MSTFNPAISTIIPSIQHEQPQVDNQLISKELVVKFCEVFKTLARNRAITATDVILYNLVRGLPINRGFTTITNKNKLENGVYPDIGFNTARFTIKHNLKTMPDTVSQRFGFSLITAAKLVTLLDNRPSIVS